MYGWSPGIGDPTIYGWATVAAYALGAFCCWRASRTAPSRERRFWLGLTAIMAFLCLNKQLDLQTLLIDFARFEAKRQGWYDRRQTIQLAFIFVLGAATALAISALLIWMRRSQMAVWGAGIGLALLLFFVFVRATSFDKMDWLIGQHLAGIKANHAMELGGIGIVTAFAWAASRGSKRRR